MANEIKVNIGVTASKGGAVLNYNTSATATMAGTNLLDATQDIGTSAEAITFGDVSGAPGLLVVTNLSATNYVEVDAVNTFDAFPQKIMPGMSIVLAPETGTIYAKAHTATVKVRKGVLDA